ncbi:hypothetical protein MHBO_002600 [Bonamia ostreae]|uniref:Uncharacterized protein n=1 Tax=Bonamia ostreae TaxID=126728 RepID=A0ABV2AMV6_9EUKA
MQISSIVVKDDKGFEEESEEESVEEEGIEDSFYEKRKSYDYEKIFSESSEYSE